MLSGGDETHIVALGDERRVAAPPLRSGHPSSAAAEPELRGRPESGGRRLLLRLGVGLALLAHRVELVAGGRDDLALTVPVALELLGVGAAPVALDVGDGAVDGLDDAVELALVADQLVAGRGHRVGVHALLVHSHVSSPSEVSVGGSGARCGQYCEEVLRCCCTSWSMVDFISMSSFCAFCSSGRCVPVHSCSNCLESSPCQFCLRDSTSWSTLVMSFWMASACCCRTLPWALTSSSFIPSQAMTFSFACVPPTDSGSSLPDHPCAGPCVSTP